MIERKAAVLSMAIVALVITLIAFVVALADWSHAHAAPPPNADRSLAPWFQSLTDPQTGGSCCGEGDCRNLPVRITDGRFEAQISGKWTPVPHDRVLDRTDNPTGDYITCVNPYNLQVLCFIRRTEF